MLNRVPIEMRSSLLASPQTNTHQQQGAGSREPGTAAASQTEQGISVAAMADDPLVGVELAWRSSCRSCAVFSQGMGAAVRYEEHDPSHSEVNMLRPDLDKWNQTPADLQRLAIEAAHPRTRERFLALHRMSVEGLGATGAARELARDPRTAMRWVRRYNEEGPGALTYQRTGGRPPLFAMNARCS